MRPVILNYLFSPITNIKGIGTKTAQALEKLLSGRRRVVTSEDEVIDSFPSKIIDLLYHAPVSITDRRSSPPLFKAKSGEIITTIVKVEQHLAPPDRNKPYRIRCYSPTGYLTLVFFKIPQDYILKALPVGNEVAVSGKVERFYEELQMTHPAYIVASDRISEIQKIERNYPLTAGLTQKQLRKAINAVLTQIPELPEWIDEKTLITRKWPSWREAVQQLHNPQSELELLSSCSSRERLAYDELLANQIALGIFKHKIRKSEGRALVVNNSKGLRQGLLAQLGFTLTAGQKQVLSEIDQDLTSPTKMLRLLQGDVGSGKTVVALLSMLTAVENHKQAAMLVPLSILAEQHFEWINNLGNTLGIRVAMLTSKIKGKKREQIITELKEGNIDILIGTHALLQSDVVFKDLAIIVIDEQHRFGVLQRSTMHQKGTTPDVLLMTATPIPRTMMLTTYGDIDVSSLKEKPANRLPIETRMLSLKKIDEVIAGLKRALTRGEKIFWICPLVEESEAVDLTAAQDRFIDFQRIFGMEQVAIIHGKMKPGEKDIIMRDFANPAGKVKILIATTVIEVGIDVSDATIIVIEHAERFGLAQMHQLRGRVGRSDKKSYCVLLYGTEIGKMSLEKMRIIRETNDGFHIAEEDLRIRGAGEVLGTKQSGFPEYRIAQLPEQQDLLYLAARNAQEVIGRVASDEAVRMLLYLFGYEGTVRDTEATFE